MDMFGRVPILLEDPHKVEPGDGQGHLKPCVHESPAPPTTPRDRISAARGSSMYYLWGFLASSERSPEKCNCALGGKLE